MTLHVAIFVFDQVEVLDFAGPYEVFTTASRLYARNEPHAVPLFEVFTLGQSRAPLRARAGLSIHPEHDFKQHPAIDVLIVPGGVISAELAKPAVIEWIKETYIHSTLTASVCTGAFLLAQAGLLHQQRATTHWEDIDEFATLFPTAQVQTQVRWVDAGKIVSSAGISAGIDMSLHLVERLAGRDLALRTARQLDFDWTENPAPL